jgi:hypothetical protein
MTCRFAHLGEGITAIVRLAGLVKTPDVLTARDCVQAEQNFRQRAGLHLRPHASTTSVL